MAAILRVKRKKDDEPQEAFLISCKRAKVEDEAAEAEEPLTALVKFAGTVEKTEDCAVDHITKSLSKNYLRANYKQHHPVDVLQKIRERTKHESKESRFKVVNSMRSVDSAITGPLDEDVVNIIDVEDTKADTDDKDTNGFVYDLYYTQTEEELKFDNSSAILPVDEEELVFEDHYRDEREHDGETSDSNSESNWRNDYPDSDECDDDDNDDDNGSIRLEAIMKAVKKIEIDSDNELSSDDEDFAYGLDEKDVDEYGYKYAKYKARLKQEEEEEEDSNDSFDDEGSDKDDFGEGYEMTISDD